MIIIAIFFILACKAEKESDFSRIRYSALYVDKTSFIEDFLTLGSNVKVITAPTKFGKSTIIDMMKRFLSVPVDINGTAVSHDTTDSYRLFCQPKLDICKNEKFVKEHLGQYPLIHINYRHLEIIRNFNTLVGKLQTVIKETFLQHRYLLNNATLFANIAEEDLFIRHCTRAGAYSLTKRLVRDAFTWLAKLLFKHFGRKVVVLLDDYDSYCNQQLYGSVENVTDIISFLGKITRSLFKRNRYVGKALLTGVLHVENVGVSPTEKNKRNYRWLGDHEFNKYYGLTEDEVVRLIRKNVKSEREINETKDVIDGYYGGYRTHNQSAKIYNVWSIVEFFNNNMTASNYWIDSSHFSRIGRYTRQSESFLKRTKQLVLAGRYASANISNPLNAQDIIDLQQKPEGYENIERLTRLLFMLGYLTKVSRQTDERDMPQLDIPNKEIYQTFCKHLENIYLTGCHIKPHVTTDIANAIRSFKPKKNNTKLYKSFFQSVFNTIHNSEDYYMSGNDLRYFLFATIASQFPATQLPTHYLQSDITAVTNMPEILRQTAEAVLEEYRTKFNSSRVNSGRTDAVANTHGIVIVIKIKCQIDRRKNIKLENLAKEGLYQALLIYKPYLEKIPVKFLKCNINVQAKEVIYIGLSYDKQNRSISMALYNPHVDRDVVVM